jgi:hypothetical protein
VDSDLGITRTRPRFACSGTVIGSVTAMRELYKDLVDELPRTQLSDQGNCSPRLILLLLFNTNKGIFNKFLAARRLSVDYRSRLFWATSFASANKTTHFINTPYFVDPLVPHELYPPLLHHAPTGEIPVAVHFNSPEKKIMDEWWGKFWWNQWVVEDSRFRDIVANRMEGAKVRFAEGGSMAWTEICPRFGM